MSKTVVWVQASVLSNALGLADELTNKKKSSTVDLDRSGGIWKWTRCELISGDISSSDSPLGVKVLDEDSNFFQEDGGVVTIGPDLLKTSDVTPMVVMANDFTSSENIPEDLITLTHLHEPAVVYSLKKRYEENKIYTATGPILIALNPFKAIPELYDDIVMNEYWMEGENKADLNLKPHIYQNAHAAFKSMMQGLEMQKEDSNSSIIVDQSMLVSGESGAGKTVTTKHVMKYLASLSQRKASFNKKRRDASPGRSGDPDGGRRKSSVSSSRLSVSSASSKNFSMRSSRAFSWKAGAVVEERSEFILKKMILVIYASTVHTSSNTFFFNVLTSFLSANMI